MLLATAACKFCASDPKVVRACCVLYILNYKRLSPYSGVQVFDIPTSKSAPNLHFFNIWTCKVLATATCNFFHIPTSKNLQKVVRTRQFFHILICKCASCYSGVQIFQHPNIRKWSEHFCFNILTCKCASRYSGVQFFISPLNSYLRTRRFTEPTQSFQ